jgi:hypothetical protein
MSAMCNKKSDPRSGVDADGLRDLAGCDRSLSAHAAARVLQHCPFGLGISRGVATEETSESPHSATGIRAGLQNLNNLPHQILEGERLGQ